MPSLTPQGFLLPFHPTFHSTPSILPILRTTSYCLMCTTIYSNLSKIRNMDHLLPLAYFTFLCYLSPSAAHLALYLLINLNPLLYELLTHTKQRKLYSLLHSVRPNPLHPPLFKSPLFLIYSSSSPLQPPTVLSHLRSTISTLISLLQPCHFPLQSVVTPPLIFSYQTQNAFFPVGFCTSSSSFHPATNFRPMMIFPTLCAALGYNHFFTITPPAPNEEHCSTDRSHRLSHWTSTCCVPIYLYQTFPTSQHLPR